MSNMIYRFSCGNKSGKYFGCFIKIVALFGNYAESLKLVEIAHA